MQDIAQIAARVDADEKLSVKYRFPVRSADGEVNHEVREGKVLDADADACLIYVSYNGEIIWIRPEEVIEIGPATD